MKIKISGQHNTEITLEHPVLVSKLLRENGYDISMPCGGQHRCGKCRVKIKGNVSPVSDEEKRLLGGYYGEYRLSCFARVTGDCEIITENHKADVLSDGFMSAFPLTPDNGRYGLAVDIGTTTIAMYGYELETGKLVYRSSAVNPQCVYGGDVISRIRASVEGSGSDLASLVSGTISAGLRGLCSKTGISECEIGSAVITGNTAMLYLLLGYDVNCLSRAPFEITDYLDTTVAAGDIGISGFDSLKVYLPRTMAAFVGSDITCSAVAVSDIMRTGGVSLLLDIGTNGEIVLYSDGSLYCCSTAAGPAFEGAGITMGGIASDGSINKVWAENGKIYYEVTGGGKASYICGSGIIDAVAAFLDAGLIDETGAISDPGGSYGQMLCDYDGQQAISVGDSRVVITQQDIRAVQLAKSAICAGIYSLMDACGISEDGIDRLLLAGGFGSAVNAESAAKIGLIPAKLVKKARAVGNAAGMGASAMLLSREARETGSRFAANSQVIDLTSSGYFSEKYIDCMLF